MQSQDIVILLKLVSIQNQEEEQDGHHPSMGVESGEDPFSVRNLEAALGISKTEVSASLKRSLISGLAARDGQHGRPRPKRRQLFNFIIHGLKFAFPAKPGTIQRGIPTGFSAPMLDNELMSAGRYSYVWPYARGHSEGISVTPLYKSVPDAAQRDDRLYEYLALTDAIRLGNQREVGLAGERLSGSLLTR